ncbi:MAG: c-type cytochrome [Bacteroidetes bacterium]|nr:c-type cytochrome [Bacteroidota bacterium]
MKKALKWIGIILGSLIVIVFIVAYVLISRWDSRTEKKYDIAVEKLTIPGDSMNIARGKRWLPLCQSCHGEALQGKVFFDDPKIGTIYSPNLTAGNGGIGNKYKDEDWIRSLRHGVNPEGRPLVIMPSKDFHHFSKEDLVDLIAYLKKIPPVDNIKGQNRIPAFTKILMQLGAFGEIISAEILDHKAEFQIAPADGPTAEYGKYLVQLVNCQECHGKEYNGGKSPDPNSPLGPNITAGGNIGKWSSEQFMKTLRTGTTPEGKVLNDTFMPWKHIGQMPDDYLTGIHAYLHSLPKKETAKLN